MLLLFLAVIEPSVDSSSFTGCWIRRLSEEPTRHAN